MFNPGTGPDRYWTDGQPNTEPAKRLKIEKPANQSKVKVSTGEKAKGITLEDTFVADSVKGNNTKVQGFMKAQTMPRPWVFPEDIEVDSDDSDATVEMQDDDPYLTEGNPVPGHVGGPFITPTQRRTGNTEDDSHATMALPDADISISTGSLGLVQMVKTLLAVSSSLRIGRYIQTMIMNSIDWKRLGLSIRNDIVGVIHQESTKKEIEQIIKNGVIEKSLVENLEITNFPTGLHLGDLVDKEQVDTMVSLVAQKAIFKSICFEGLQQNMVKQLMDSLDLEGLKAKVIERILQNEVPVGGLEGVVRSEMEGEMDV
jgi:hypothetical protein